MSVKEQNAYILGTEKAELHRLGLQHQVWAGEAIKGWKLAGFTQGQTILDLGCGPGYCTTELAFMAGEKGKVIGVDKSASFISFLSELATKFNLNIEAQCTDFENMQLLDNTLDRVYCRWALAWISNPKEVIKRLHKALKKGGIIVTHEYFDWSTLQTEPYMPNLAKGIAAALQSLQDQDGDIDISRKLPVLFKNAGFEIQNTRPMTKMVGPHDLAWHWPKSFFEIYLPKLISAGYLTEQEVLNALAEFNALEKDPGAILFCPVMQEVIAKKI